MKQAFPYIISLLLILLPLQTSAQLTANSEAPIDITGDSAEFQDNKAIWTGNVRVVQEDAVLTTDKLVAKVNDDGDIQSINAAGNVRYSNGKEAITGENGFYDGKKRTITITDNVIVTQGKQILAAGEVIYWVDSGRVKFNPAAGRRIRGIFYTEEDGQS